MNFKIGTKKILLILLLSPLFWKCDPNNQKLKIINNSSDTIYYRLLMDTILNKNLYLYEINPNESIFPNFVKGLSPTDWEYKINKYSIDSTLYLFIFKSSTILDETIINGQYEMKGYKVEELDNLNWEISLLEFTN